MGVTYEREVDCGSGGLRYSWTLLDSAGAVFPLPAIDTHGQTLTLPGFLLDYDTYTAVARVRERRFAHSNLLCRRFPKTLSALVGAGPQQRGVQRLQRESAGGAEPARGLHPGRHQRLHERERRGVLGRAGIVRPRLPHEGAQVGRCSG